MCFPGDLPSPGQAQSSDAALDLQGLLSRRSGLVSAAGAGSDRTTAASSGSVIAPILTKRIGPQLGQAYW